MHIDCRKRKGEKISGLEGNRKEKERRGGKK